jgi:thioesterase domain-containing protein
MKREQDLNIQKPSADALNARALSLSPNKRALLRQRLTRRKSDLQTATTSRHRQLVAYVVPHQNQSLTSGDLRSFLKRRLPEYMVPGAIVTLRELPLTVNGKIDKQRLQALNDARHSMKERFVGPRDMLEFQLVRLWELVLGIQPICVTDNFFDLGGHSLLAVRLMAGIRNVFKRDLPLSVLFQEGTIERLARILRQETGLRPWSCLVELQSSGSRPPLFFVHPAGGNVLSYLELIRCLGPDQPFYAFQTPGLYGEQIPYTTVEYLAAHYITALRKFQPEGPYILGGWSLGGIVAYEMTQQLVAQGQRVSQLLLLDSTPWAFEEEYIEENDTITLMKLLAAELPIPREHLQQFSGDEQICDLLKKAISANLIPPDLEVEQLRSLLNVYRTNVKAAHQYAPRVYSGAVTLFKPSKQLTIPPIDRSSGSTSMEKMTQDPTMGWNALALGGVRIIDVNGDHQTMIRKPHVEALALQISNCLN